MNNLKLNMHFFQIQGFAERKVGFSMEEEDEDELKNESDGGASEEVEKLHPIKLHRR